eukprot:UN1367
MSNQVRALLRLRLTGQGARDLPQPVWTILRSFCFDVIEDGFLNVVKLAALVETCRLRFLLTLDAELSCYVMKAASDGWDCLKLHVLDEKMHAQHPGDDGVQIKSYKLWMAASLRQHFQSKGFVVAHSVDGMYELSWAPV